MSGLMQILATGGAVLAVSAVILYKLFPWLKYDLQFLLRMGKAGVAFKRLEKANKLLVDIFEERVKAAPGKVFIVFEEQKYTYEFMNRQANKVANLAASRGIKKKDVVALLIHNEPAFIWTYLGLSKIGVEPAFLNFNLRSTSLLHCFNVSDASTLIIGQGGELLDAVKEIYPEMSNNNNKIDMLVQGSADLPQGFTSFDDLFDAAPDTQPERSVRAGIGYKDVLNYIFTSGTTGLPKAAVVSHAKGIKGSLLMDTVDVSRDDILYTPLPLYHSAAGLIALGTTIHKGATLVLRRKFSASQFFEDCARHDVTVVQYIGELCRYLCAKPKAASDRGHKVRVAFGNGLRADVWKEFQERFNIPVIGEFYAATEGNAGFINFFNRRGCVGRASPLLERLFPTTLLRYDMTVDAVVRDAAGLCVPVKQGEAGLMVSEIKRDFEFDGYKGNRELSERKVVRDVFRKGDMFFNTGDLMTCDKDYFVYFTDRIGDTFRWKGENVSTIEVSNVISSLEWVEDANVYGVSIPGQDGRAGMVALTLAADESLTDARLAELYAQCSRFLPAYACPKFLRLQSSMMITGTFKQQKFTLVKEGYDPAQCGSDALYVADTGKTTFQPITDSLVSRINEGQYRL